MEDNTSIDTNRLRLNALIERSYDLFSKYTIGKKLRVCNYCCVTEAEEKELVNTPLREVSRDLLHHAYISSARDGSARELWEMKHFLPRVLELVGDLEFPCHSCEITFQRLDLDQPEKWDKEELTLLKEFSKLFFQNCIQISPLKEGLVQIIKIVIMFGSAHFDIKPLLLIWESDDSVESLLHLRNLYNCGINKNNGIHQAKLTNGFLTPEVDAVFFDWFTNDIKHKFAKKVETMIVDSKDIGDMDFYEMEIFFELKKIRERLLAE